MNEWYTIKNVSELDTPALAIYPERVKKNIATLINSIDDVKRLRPHIKTHKSAEVSKMMLQAGITKFKCATISEAEMLASSGAPDVLLAYQPIGPKIKRLAELKKKYPQTKFACLVDDPKIAGNINTVFHENGLSINLYIDLNVGMNRTGITPEKALALYTDCQSLSSATITGLHAYDGHLRDIDFSLRTKNCDEAFANVLSLRNEIDKKFGKHLSIVAGGTPTFSIHCKRKEAECSPGTFIYWDKGYEQILREQHYLHAALVVTRVISKPADNVICVDLGHKAIASENPLDKRVYFLNAPELEPVGHSEEHMVLKTKPDRSYQVGDVLYGVPYHVCPTIALYDHPAVIENNNVVEYWSTLSRNRKITV